MSAFVLDFYKVKTAGLSVLGSVVIVFEVSSDMGYVITHDL